MPNRVAASTLNPMTIHTAVDLWEKGIGTICGTSVPI
jgi:hypothetical protein